MRNQIGDRNHSKNIQAARLVDCSWTYINFYQLSFACGIQCCPIFHLCFSQELKKNQSNEMGANSIKIQFTFSCENILIRVCAVCGLGLFTKSSNLEKTKASNITLTQSFNSWKFLFSFKVLAYGTENDHRSLLSIFIKFHWCAVNKWMNSKWWKEKSAEQKPKHTAQTGECWKKFFVLLLVIIALFSNAMFCSIDNASNNSEIRQIPCLLLASKTPA